MGRGHQGAHRHRAGAPVTAIADRLLTWLASALLGGVWSPTLDACGLAPSLAWALSGRTEDATQVRLVLDAYLESIAEGYRA